jgi:demethylmenaquinone methyltransferase/2-methoxy-6-polyprenyl-1,4-benzoquinol methylase
MHAYYEARAGEYEDVYAKPERQADLARLRAWLAAEARGRAILEIACGTGYWTAIAAATARLILGIDRSAASLELARSKALGPRVDFALADAYALPGFAGSFDCGMAHFFLSHVPNARRGDFLADFASRLCPGAKLLLIDNAFVVGSSTPIARRDDEGNTYQLRTLKTGERHEVLKNFPTTREIEAALSPVASQVDVLQLTYYWAARAILA